MCLKWTRETNFQIFDSKMAFGSFDIVFLARRRGVAKVSIHDRNHYMQYTGIILAVLLRHIGNHFLRKPVRLVSGGTFRPPLKVRIRPSHGRAGVPEASSRTLRGVLRVLRSHFGL